MHIYRDIYITAYNEYPTDKFIGKGKLFYSGDILFKFPPEGFEQNNDLHIACPCEFDDLQSIEKVEEK